MPKDRYILIGVVLIVTVFVVWAWQWWNDTSDPKLSPAQYKAAATDAPPKQPGEKRIVWIMHSWVPNVRAGSEITAEAQIDYLRAHGWTVFVLVNRWAVPEYKGVKIYPIQSLKLTQSPGVEALFKSADLICVQNFSIVEIQITLGDLGTPIVVFLHTENDNVDILNFRSTGGPLYVVYNGNHMKLSYSNHHPSIVVHPKVNTKPFRIPKNSPRYVTLVNCNENKGGTVLPELARALPDVQFLGVRGGYDKQVVDPRPPPNLTYMKTQKDMAAVYAKTKLLIMPSRSETWGRTAVEAMASGTPVIVSRSPGLLECVGKAEISCDRNDTSCWIEKVQELMTNADAYETASRKAAERCDELDKEEEFERLLGFVEEIRTRHTVTAAERQEGETDIVD